MVVGEGVTDWLGDTGILLVRGCDVLVGTMVPKWFASVVTVSLLMEYIGETDDAWSATDDPNPLAEFEEKVCGGTRELDEETEDVID